MTQADHARPRVWPGFVSALIGGLIGVGGTFTGVLISGVFGAGNTVATITYTGGAAAGRDCLTYETWVLDRLSAGLDTTTSSR